MFRTDVILVEYFGSTVGWNLQMWKAQIQRAGCIGTYWGRDTMPHLMAVLAVALPWKPFDCVLNAQDPRSGALKLFCHIWTLVHHSRESPFFSILSFPRVSLCQLDSLSASPGQNQSGPSSRHSVHSCIRHVSHLIIFIWFKHLLFLLRPPGRWLIWHVIFHQF